ncbi:MAG: hypothetical protein AB1486_28505 [Planctomycetota bacterium]
MPISDQALALPWLGVKSQPAIQRLIDAYGPDELNYGRKRSEVESKLELYR